MAVAAALMAGNAQADTVTLTQIGGNDNGGGLFQAVTSANGTFNTFCISIGTTFSPGTQYNYTLSSVPSVNPSFLPTGFNYISYGTALLYHDYLTMGATFAGEDTVAHDLDAIQAAIWYSQGELNGTIDPENSKNLAPTFATGVDDLTGILGKLGGLTQAQLQANGNGAFGVVAMNLSDGVNPHQPQLAVVPEVSTVISAALLLLPFGASALRISRKNKVS